MRPSMILALLAVCIIADSSATKDYATALGKSILFYTAQRSGKLPADNPIPWRQDSGLNDCVVGGWYDAGDHVKFGLPMASSATLLAWSLVSFKDGYAKSGQLDNMYDSIKWPLDYFLKAWDPNTGELVVQIGDGKLDHAYWGRPSDMTMQRPCIKISPGSPGSSIAGGTAAALAAGSVAFADKDAVYASKLLRAADSLYAFAKNNRGIYKGTNYIQSEDGDELCDAAVWLYRATKDSAFLQEAEEFFANAKGGFNVGWGDKKMFCGELLYEATGNALYKKKVEDFFTRIFPGGKKGVYTPCGHIFLDQWGSNRHASNAAYLALHAAESGINPDVYRKFAVEQINYILGDNNHDGGCYSYLVGYGNKFPLKPHHRGASCPDRPARCNWSHAKSTAPNPQVLEGALTGGPGKNDEFEDSRQNYIQNEVALDYNAGFQGALAAIVHLQNAKTFPATNNKCPCKQ